MKLVAQKDVTKPIRVPGK